MVGDLAKVKLVCLGRGLFNPCDVECLRLIGQKGVALD
jgi:hypothetical protein